ncbi:caspase family protein [Streptomyces sp. NPDC047718]|uniref:caspase family protein n=1 Tax=Streptomyces sp. NPDC047718 TaxID=3155479 RepID=UPI0033CB4ED4
MVETTAPDPARVHAVVVGIEHFKHIEGLDLPGAAADAMRFARWLRMRGVPKDNVTLLLTPLKESWQALNEQAQQLDLTITFAGSRDVIMNALAPRSREDVPEGDVLYVYWGGHGLLGRGERRLLLCPDVTNQDPRCIDLTDLREHLGRPDVAGYRRQMFLVDACATFIENRRQVATPAVAAFPAGQRATVEQFMLLAAAAGQAAVQAGADKTGVFSTAVLEWLERHSPGLDPDLDALVAHVKEHFAGRRLGRRPVQTPVSWVIRSFGGDTEEIAPGAAEDGTEAPAPVAAPAVELSTPAAAAPGRPAGRRRAVVWAGAGAAVVLAAAAVALNVMPGRGDGADGKAGAAGAGASAVASAAAPSAPSPSPPPSPSPSALGSTAPGAGAPSAPGTPVPATQPAAEPASGALRGCRSTAAVREMPAVKVSPCYVIDGGKVTLAADVTADKPTDVTVYLWLSTSPDNTYLYPPAAPYAQTVTAGRASQRVSTPVGNMQLRPGRYDVHVSVAAKGASPPKAADNTTVTGYSQWFVLQ